MKEPQQQAQASVIWMHGLGADASDMIGLADQLPVPELTLRHVFLDAPARPVTLNGGMVMQAWYDILGSEFADREDKIGIEKSALTIRPVIEAQLADGFQLNQVFLAGFSQGGAMALHTALNTEGRLGGVIALSAYLPLARDTTPVLDKETPFFMGSGQFDPLVLPKWTQDSKDWIVAKGYKQMDFHSYPMQHSVCFNEVRDLGVWLARQVQGVV